MAQYPSRFDSKFSLQPGARGEKFKVDMPGYRDKEKDFVNRTHMNLPTNEHDTLNTKYLLDPRLPVLFTYGMGYGFNQIIIPKGRFLSADPISDAVDFETRKQFNIVTLANGGVPVRIREQSDVYDTNKLVSKESQGQVVGNVGIEFIPVAGLNATYDEKCYRAFSTGMPSEQLSAAGFTVNPEDGKVYKTEDLVITKNEDTGEITSVEVNGPAQSVIMGNVPLGIATRNEYTRDDDAFNGMMVGAINTDCIVRLPWFAFKDKAEGNPWGSVYGPIFPGALVKADENGRLTISPLSFEDVLAKMSASEIEMERQQIIGKVVDTLTDLVPEGAPRWATWALSDRLDFVDFNPDEWAQNGRRGEDVVPRTPYASSGKYPGYMYDHNYGAHDLHMFASIRRNYDLRMQPEYQYENLGIPGLTDGYNAVNRNYDAVEIGKIAVTKDATDIASIIYRLPEVDVNDISICVGKLGDDAANLLPLVEGNKYGVKADVEAEDGSVSEKSADDVFVVDYANNKQAIFRIKPVSLQAVNDFAAQIVPEGKQYVELPVYAKFSKRGLAGIPTYLDWDGVVGSASILLQM